MPYVYGEMPAFDPEKFKSLEPSRQAAAMCITRLLGEIPAGPKAAIQEVILIEHLHTALGATHLHDYQRAVVGYFAHDQEVYEASTARAA